jgi:hypothetical protein
MDSMSGEGGWIDIDPASVRDLIADTRANEGCFPTAAFLVERLRLDSDRRTFRRFTEAVEQTEEELEIRDAHSRLNGMTEDGNGAQQIAVAERLYCTKLEGGSWRVEFHDGRRVLTVIVPSARLMEGTNRRLT